MLLKVCGLKHKSNIEEVRKLKPDLIGLIFYPLSARVVTDDLMFSIYVQSIHDIKKTGVFVNQSKAFIIEKIDEYNLDFIQLHGNESPEFCQSINEIIPVIKAHHIDADFDFEKLSTYQDTVTYFLFDTYTKNYGGSGQKFNWTKLKDYNLNIPYLLSGGISLEDVSEIKNIQHKAFIGIDVNSRFEIEPGVKNIEKLKILRDEIRN